MKIVYFLPALLFLSSAVTGTAAESRGDSLLAARKHFSFAVQYKKSGEYGDALLQYEKSIALNDTVWQVHFSFADLLMLMKRSDRAKGEYLRTLALFPGHRPSAETVLRMYLAASAYDSALAVYDILLGTAPDDSLLADAVRLREHLGRNGEALAGLRVLIARKFPDPGLPLRAADLALKTGDTASAVSFAEQALEAHPKDPVTLRTAVKAATLAGDHELAARGLEALASADSTNAGILAELAGVYRTSGNRPALIRTLEREIALKPESAELYGGLAEIFLEDGVNDRAGEYVKKALALSPDDGRFLIIMGEVFRAKGLNSQALAEYRKALADPRWEEAARKLIPLVEPGTSENRNKEKEFFQRGKKP